MIDPDVRVKIRHYFFAEHWRIGTIAAELQVHPDTVRRAIEVEKFQNAAPLRASLLDPYLPFLRETLEAHPRLRVTRLHRMLGDRGYAGSIRQLRRSVAPLRPRPQEAFLRTQVFAGEQAQVDWAHFGAVMVGRARRTLSCFVMTLSWSRALYLEFFFDQSMESFLRGHVHAFASFQGSARVLLYDNLKSAVLDRHGSHVHFNPRLLELAGHYHFVSRPCQVRAGNQKGRVERAIRFVRDSYWAARGFTTLEECNRQATQQRWSPRQLMERMVQIEMEERAHRSLERRLRSAGIRKFKPLADFEWTWPTSIEREVIERAMTLDFLAEARNLVLVGANGLGKTMIAQNICHAAVLAGHSVLFRTASALLEDLHRQTPEGRLRKLRTYANVSLMCID